MYEPQHSRPSMRCVRAWHRHESRRHSVAARCATAVALIMAILMAAATFPQSAGAQTPQPPANGNCTGTAVVAKLSVIEDVAAANMLVEAAKTLGLGQRCLVDAGDPDAGQVPASSRRELRNADRVFVVGGPATVPDPWLRSQLGVSSFTRIAGGNRWETQSTVAAAIISLTRGEPIIAYQGQPGSNPDLPPNTGCTNAVLVKQNVVEDLAAANMLAETLDRLSPSRTDRCLIDVGDPQNGIAPSRSAKNDSRSAQDHYVIGGTAAIPNSWLRTHFSSISASRLAGADRWATQAAVAEAIVNLSGVAGDEEDVLLDPGPATPLREVALDTGDGVQMLDIQVYYCGKSGVYSASDLDQWIDELNAVASFWQQESVGTEQVSFNRGEQDEGFLSPPGIENYVTQMQWIDNDVRGKCLAQISGTGTSNILLLANNSGAGFAPLGNHRNEEGLSAVVTIPARRASVADFLGSAAHELGHAFYGLKHPWMDFAYLCNKIDEIESTNYNGNTVLAMHEQTFCSNNKTTADKVADAERDEMLASIMSYDRYGSLRDVAGTAYVACYQSVMLGWQSADACDRYRATVPAQPFPPRVNPEPSALHVSWSSAEPNGADIEGYRVQYRPAGSSQWIDWPVQSGLLETRITGLDWNTTYEVRVLARNRVGESPWSNYDDGTPLPLDVPTRRVHLSLGERVQGRSDCTSESCHWLHVEIEGFPAGSHTLACAHNGVHQLGVSRGVYASAPNAVSNDSPSTNDCFFGYPDNEVFVIVGAELRDGVWHGGTYSNSVVWSDALPLTAGANLNDRPILIDQHDDYSWWRPPASVNTEGYGDNGFHFTLVIGNSPDNETDNIARWEFEPVDGDFDVQAWIPARWATADVQYRIWADANGDGQYGSNELVAEPWLNQATGSGWRSLGVHRLNGRVRVEVRDTRANDDWRIHGEAATRLAVDAMQLVPTDSRVGHEVYNDEPLLVDLQGDYTWWKPPDEVDRLGYGSNGFHFTLAAARKDVDDVDNFARWDFDAVNGTYEVEAWIPASWATAHVQYLIWVDSNGDGRFDGSENLAGPYLDQQSVRGWQSLGRFDFNGRVRIEVWDTRTEDDWTVVGEEWARLAVDAIRLRQVS